MQTTIRKNRIKERAKKVPLRIKIKVSLHIFWLRLIHNI